MSRSGVAVALLAGALALVVLPWTVGQRPRPVAGEKSAAPAKAEPEVPLVASAAPQAGTPADASDASAPIDAGSARTAAEPTPLVLTFRVLEKDTDAPIAGAHLRTYEDSAPGTWTTDERGECAVTLPAGAHDFRLHVEKEGFEHLAL